ncbi:metal-dependent hydrolase [Salinilacihabitans rarus]|uniref:metal-dependent hydrolase n=1 Tax=Salinilacihabitans rarus TaxID=2961596 RepID=UPI0020C860F9|nr:metal-dependent hydrolase [Salinilacihabitans rarus]
MHQSGHYGAALLAYSPVGAVVVALGFDAAAVGGAVVVVGLSMLPDVDVRLPNVSHRGPTHTVYFAAAVGVVTGTLGGVVGATGGPFGMIALAAFGFTLGAVAVLSHLGADALTPMGVRPFADGRHYSLGVCRAANPIANYALLGVGLAVAVAAYWVGAGIAAVVGG